MIRHFWVSFDGVIGWGEQLPRAVLPLGTARSRAEADRLEAAVTVLARHSRTDASLLVPGMPEADTFADLERAYHRMLDAMEARVPGLPAKAEGRS
jgi:hypothetical protein